MAGIFLRTGAKGGGGTMAMLNRNWYFLIIVLVGLLSISVLFLMEERTLFDAVAVSSALKYLDDSPMTSTEADIGEGRASTLPLQNSVLPQKEEQKLLRGRNDKAEHMRNKGLTSSNHGGNYTLRDATDEGVHTVAGLSCENYGGPQDDIAAEMVYWSDIPRDSDHVSPFQFYGPEKKYITFEPDEAGWNNVRMALETVIALALAMGRTLVLPPEQSIPMLQKRDENSKNHFSFRDFFHIDSVALEHTGLEVITMQEFLETEVLTGNIRHPETGESLQPPRNRTDWDGIGTFFDDDWKELAIFIRSLAINPIWNGAECLATFPARVGPGTAAHLEKMMEEIVNGADAALRIQGYDSNPTPVDASAKDRMEESIIFRRELCVYEDEIQKQQVVHFRGTGDGRLLYHFYSFLYFEDYRQDLWMKRFVRDHLRYVDEIQCAAARIVHTIRQKAIGHGNPDGEFDAFHIRRGDFHLLYPGAVVDAEEIFENTYEFLRENSTVYIATDETNMTFFDPLRKHHHVYFLNDFMDEVGNININFMGMVEQRVCSRGRVFFGTYYSTFTGYINRMRGYHSQLDSPDAIRTGALQSYYYAPKTQIRATEKYRALNMPLWPREFPVGWRDLNKGIEDEALVER